MTEFPGQLVIPVGAVLAATITAIASFVSLMVAKEQKISEFRQAWIDALRMELSDFSSNARRVSTEEHPIDLSALSGSILGSIEARNKEIVRPDPFHENRLRLAHAYYAVRLRLNPDEADHATILRNMDAVYVVLGEYSGDTRFDKVVEALGSLSVESQSVLKREWKRVKEGEPNYKHVAISAKVIGLGLAIVLGGLIIYGVAGAI